MLGRLCIDLESVVFRGWGLEVFICGIDGYWGFFYRIIEGLFYLWVRKVSVWLFWVCCCFVLCLRVFVGIFIRLGR